jgi:hypothetical protein
MDGEMDAWVAFYALLCSYLLETDLHGEQTGGAARGCTALQVLHRMRSPEGWHIFPLDHIFHCVCLSWVQRARTYVVGQVESDVSPYLFPD